MSKRIRFRALLVLFLLVALALMPVNSSAAPAGHRHHHRHWHMVSVLGWHRGSRKADQPQIIPATKTPPGGGGPEDPDEIWTTLHDADGHPFPLRENVLAKIVVKHNLSLFFTHMFFLHTHRPAAPRPQDHTSYEYRNTVSRLRCLNPAVLATCDPVPVDDVQLLGVVKFAPARGERFNKGVVTLYCEKDKREPECPDWVSVAIPEPR